MKNELRIILLSFLITLGIFYFIFNFAYNFTGLVVEDSVQKEIPGVSIVTGFGILVEFSQSYWEYFLMGLGILVIISFIAYRGFRIKSLKKKIRKMKAERKVVIHLMKIAQIRRFKQNKISGLVYEIRMKQYQEKLGKIKQELPVLQSRLEKYLKKKRKVKKEKLKGGKK